MYKETSTHYTRLSRPVRRTKAVESAAHHTAVLARLKQLGANRMELASMESKYLPQLIYPDETIGGVVYGFNDRDFAMLVATDRRVIFLDRKPLFVNEDEINYFVVSGVSYGHLGLGATVTLHTRLQDYRLRTFNERCSSTFVDFIEARCLHIPNQQTT